MVHTPKRGRQAVNYAQLPDPGDYFSQHLPDFAKHNKPRNGWVCTSCPACTNNKQNLILNVVTGAFRCFGCGINGPTVAHMHQHLKNLSLEEAAQDLGAWGEAV